MNANNSTSAQAGHKGAARIDGHAPNRIVIFDTTLRDGEQDRKSTRLNSSH